MDVLDPAPPTHTDRGPSQAVEDLPDDLGWSEVRQAGGLAIKSLLRGQTNFPRMPWKLNAVYNPERQYADHQKPVTYEMRPPRLLSVKPSKDDLYVHASAPVERQARGA